MMTDVVCTICTRPQSRGARRHASHARAMPRAARHRLTTKSKNSVWVVALNLQQSLFTSVWVVALPATSTTVLMLGSAHC